MGIFASKLFANLFGPQEMRIIMVGLDYAGKTTVLYKLKLGEVVTTIPTIGFNVETVAYNDISFTAWDVGGANKLRPLYKHYYRNTQGVIFVVDSNDTERIDEATHELHIMLQDDLLQDASVLVLANKQDLPNAMSASLLIDKMRLNQVCQEWYLQSSCAAMGDGLYEGFDWLAKACRNKPRSSAA